MSITEEEREIADLLTREETEKYFNSIVGKVFIQDLNGKRTYVIPYAIEDGLYQDTEIPLYMISGIVISFPEFHGILCTPDGYQKLFETGYTDNGTMREVMDRLWEIFEHTLENLDYICDDETFADEMHNLYCLNKRVLEVCEEERMMMKARKMAMDTLPFPIKKPRTMSPYKERLSRENE